MVQPITETKSIAVNPRIVLIGSVNSSKMMLKKLNEHQMNVVLVLGLNPAVAQNVSGFQDLRPIAEDAGYSFSYFEKVNDASILQLVQEAKPDLIFVIGLSQLIGKSLIDMAKFGAIGYHPTKLPQGRGRAAIGWIVLGKVEGAANLFMIDEGTDAGPILAQLPIEVTDTDYAQDVIDKVVYALASCCDLVLPKLKTGELTFTYQNQEEATYLGIRKPNDGIIDWNGSSVDVARLVRAVSKPLPGAFTVYQRKKLYIWRAKAIPNFNIMGVPGRILAIDENGFYVATSEGALLVTEFTCSIPFVPKVGIKLGFNYSKIFLDE